MIARALSRLSTIPILSLILTLLLPLSAFTTLLALRHLAIIIPARALPSSVFVCLCLPLIPFSFFTRAFYHLGAGSPTRCHTLLIRTTLTTLTLLLITLLLLVPQLTPTL